MTSAGRYRDPYGAPDLLRSRDGGRRTQATAMVLVARRTGRPPAEFRVSIPDSHKRQGDLDLLLSSLKVS